jgi:glucose/arabinose dehydrogenase
MIRTIVVLLLSLFPGPMLRAIPGDRVANTSLNLPLELPVNGYALTNAFGDLVFEQPVAMVSPPGETNRLFVVERTGRIMVITNLARPTKSLFIDLQANLYSRYVEAGLLGLAFHPGYASNGFLFVYRTATTSTEGAPMALHDILSRFEVSPDDPNSGLPESEVRIFAQYDQFDYHNAGDLHFGPDGYLYVSLGEQVFLPDEVPETRQPIDKNLFGGILRLDVDQRPGNLPPNPHPAVTANYAIPWDNPFVGTTNYQGLAVDPARVRTEFYAVGFRNPWRFCIDPWTGELYCGDVGGALAEEINLVQAGGNYGWPYREGLHFTGASSNAPPGFSSIPPIAVFEHGNKTNEDNAVIGGVVYRGNRIPDLQGCYVFGGHTRGHIWSLKYDAGAGTHSFRYLTGDPGISAFGIDPRNQDVLVANFWGGRLKRLVYVPPEEAEPFPETLAETGIFSNLLTLVTYPGIVPYQVNVPFWSDNAIKSRWFSLPDVSQKIGFDAAGNWNFPTGIVWIKHFELELTNGVASSRHRVETRFIVKNENGIYGVTYRWGNSLTNASLVPAQGMDEVFEIHDGDQVRTQTWHYPSRSECTTCHREQGGFGLGFNTPQMNLEEEGGDPLGNQILALSEAGYFETPATPAPDWRKLRPARDAATPLYDRVRSYLSANCSHCHQPNTGTTLVATWDARLHDPFPETGILDRLVVANAPEDSPLYMRIANLGEAHMPPIATAVLDTNGISLVREWILAFPRAPWNHQDVGAGAREGSAAIEDEVYTVAGSGADAGGQKDALHFLYRTFPANGQIVARLQSQQNTGPQARAGIIFRESANANARFAMASLGADGGAFFERRIVPGSLAIRETLPTGTGLMWVRLLRQGDSVSAQVSANGRDWTGSGFVTLDFPDTLLAGIAVTSDDSNAVNMAVFDPFQYLTVSLTAAPATDIDPVAPATFSLRPEITVDGTTVTKVEFYVDGQKQGETLEAPHELVWSNAPAGLHSLVARVVDGNGLTVDSRPLEVSVAAPHAVAGDLTPDTMTHGNWDLTLGTDGVVIAGDSTNLPPAVDLMATDNATLIWDENAPEGNALRRASGAGFIAAAWEAPTEFSLDLDLRDGRLHQISFYFLDWDTTNKRRQTVDVLDAESGAPLGSQAVSEFSNGVYLRWRLRGHVRVRIRATGNGSAVLSGIFLDEDFNAAPQIEWKAPAAGTVLTAPAQVTLEAEAMDPDGSIEDVSFYVNGARAGAVSTPPYQLTLSNMLAGDYWLTARAVDSLQEYAVSTPVPLKIDYPGSRADFLRIDETTQGNWRSTYGKEGSLLVAHGTNLPSFVDLEASPRIFVWSQGQIDTRALEYAAGSGRIAACWVSTTNFAVSLKLADGYPHQVAFYFLDWDGYARKVRVDVEDSSSGALLGTRELADFHGGKYMAWRIQGQVRFVVTRLQNNAVASGVFIDPEPSPYEAWRWLHFTDAELSDPSVSGALADPEGDLVPNLLEYAFNDDPKLANATSKFDGRIETDAGTGLSYLVVTFPRRKPPVDITYEVETTTDFRHWQSGPGIAEELLPAVDDGNGVTETATYRLLSPLEESPFRFVRLEISR